MRRNLFVLTGTHQIEPEPIHLVRQSLRPSHAASPGASTSLDCSVNDRKSNPSMQNQCAATRVGESLAPSLANYD